MTNRIVTALEYIAQTVLLKVNTFTNVFLNLTKELSDISNSNLFRTVISTIVTIS